MEYLKADIKRTPKFILAITIMAIGIMLTKRADLGMVSWGVFHQGLQVTTGISFGLITMIVGAIVLVFTIKFLHVKVGLGTILNIAIAGPIIDLSDHLFTFSPTSIWEQILILNIGMLMMTFGRSLYISTRLGQGPRDGMFVGLARKYNWPVRNTKIGIELTVLCIGFLLGGTVNFGTPYLIFMSGILVQFFFKVLHFDNNDHSQSNVELYFKRKELVK